MYTDILESLHDLGFPEAAELCGNRRFAVRPGAAVPGLGGRTDFSPAPYPGI